VSDFVHNLVLRAAGLAAGVSARPPLQPGFAPDLPTTRWGAALPRARGTQPVSRDAQPAEVPAAQPRQPERLTGGTAPPNDRGAVALPWQDVEPAAGVTPAPPSPAEDASEQPPAASRSQAIPPPMPTAIASPRKVHREEAEPLTGERVAPQRPPQSGSVFPPDAHRSPELVRGGRLSPQQGGVSPAGESMATATPDGALQKGGEQPRRPPTLSAVETPVPGPRHTISPEEPIVPAAGERAVVEPGAPLREEAIPAQALEPLPPRTSMAAPLPLVRPAPAPPPPHLAIAPLSAPPATVAEAASAVQVRIGTVEVRASRPTSPVPPRPRPQPLGFDDYAHLRGLGWE
jgi:hypothetical protein